MQKLVKYKLYAGQSGHRPALQVPEPYVGKLACPVLWGCKLPGAAIANIDSLKSFYRIVTNLDVVGILDSSIFF